MNIHKTTLFGLLVIEPTIYTDSRGYFFESYNKEVFERHGITTKFVQDNQSQSKKDVLRGLHYQWGAYAQDKLVSVSNGAVLDVAVDIRPYSPTFGKHESFLLSAVNKRMLLIPSGFAHGFVSLFDNTIFNYKCSNIYHKESEGGIIWNDPTLAINWHVENPLVSEKDSMLPKFNEHV